jgi:hypothetical protein
MAHSKPNINRILDRLCPEPTTIHFMPVRERGRDESGSYTLSRRKRNTGDVWKSKRQRIAERPRVRSLFAGWYPKTPPVWTEDSLAQYNQDAARYQACVIRHMQSWKV